MTFNPEGFIALKILAISGIAGALFMGCIEDVALFKNENN